MNDFKNIKKDVKEFFRDLKTMFNNVKNLKNSKKDINEFRRGFETMFNDLKTKGRRHKQIANIITLSRVLLACFIPPLALTGNLLPATIFAGMAAVTDGIDGFVARKLNAVSEFGKNLDPVCDKIFAGLLLAPLMIKSAPLIVLELGTNLVLEALISLVNLNSKLKGNIPRTTISGKIKTVILSFFLAFLYLSFSYQIIMSFIQAIYALTAIAQAVTLTKYYKIDKDKDEKKKKKDLPSEAIENMKSDEEDNNFEKVATKDLIDTQRPEIEIKNENTPEYFRNLKDFLLRMYPTSTNEKTIDEQAQQDGIQITKQRKN